MTGFISPPYLYLPSDCSSTSECTEKRLELIRIPCSQETPAGRVSQILSRAVSMQSCIRSLTSRRSHLGLAFRNPSSFSLSRRLPRMQAVQSRAVQTEAAPVEKQGLKSLEVCFQLFQHLCLIMTKPLPCRGSARRCQAALAICILYKHLPVCPFATHTSPSADLRTSAPPAHNNCPYGCACARRICTLRAALLQNCLEIPTQRTGGDW